MENLDGAHARVDLAGHAGGHRTLLHGGGITAQQRAAVGVLQTVPAEGRIIEAFFLAFHQRQHIHRAEHVAAGLHSGGLVQGFAHVVAVQIHGRHGSQMAARRPAEHTDVFGVDLKFRGVGPKETDGLLHVPDLIRIMALGAAAVVDGRHHIACVGKGAHLAQHQVFVRAAPAAAGNPHQSGLGGMVLPGVVLADGQLLFAVAVWQQHRELQLQGLALQIGAGGVDHIVDEIQGLALVARVDVLFHVVASYV